MNNLKAHLVPLICGVVVALALVAYIVWPLPGYSTELKTHEMSRLGIVGPIKAAANMAIVIPGLKPSNGAITKDVIDAKTTVQQQMQEDAKKIKELASQDNEAGRILRRGKQVIPLLDGKPEPNYLPVVSNDVRTNPNADPSANADPTEFADAYTNTFNRWISELATGSKVLAANFDPMRTAAPPDMTTDINPAWEAAERKRLALLPQFPGQAPPLPNPNPSAEFVRNIVNQKAAKIRMYVTRDSFYIRPQTSVNTEIFAALADCWLQADVVRAIDAINTEALAKVPEDAEQENRNVGHSPIKRLVHLAVGSGVGLEGGGSGGLFSDAGKSDVDYSKSMTGRVGTKAYDVTDMEIVMEMDPSYINRFIAGLYKQNNGYTVLDMKISAVDPFVAASNGYIYGDNQVVSVDIRVEALLFRGWTEGIMPANFGTGSGVASPAGGFGTPSGMPHAGFGFGK